jgi:hypothetical protein
VHGDEISRNMGMDGHYDPFGDFLKFGGNNGSASSVLPNMPNPLLNPNVPLTVPVISTMTVHTNILEIGKTMIDLKGLQEAVRMRYECLDSSHPPLKAPEAAIRGKLLEIINQDY